MLKIHKNCNVKFYYMFTVPTQVCPGLVGSPPLLLSSPDPHTRHMAMPGERGLIGVWGPAGAVFSAASWNRHFLGLHLLQSLCLVICNTLKLTPYFTAPFQISMGASSTQERGMAGSGSQVCPTLPARSRAVEAPAQPQT